MVGDWSNNPLVGYGGMPEGNRSGMNAQQTSTIDNRNPDGTPNHGQNARDFLSALGTGASMVANPMMGMVNLGFSMASPSGHAPSTLNSWADLKSMFGGVADQSSSGPGLSAGTVGTQDLIGDGTGGYGIGSGALNAVGPGGLNSMGDITGGGSMFDAPDGRKGEETYEQGGFTGGQEGVPAGEVHGKEFVFSAPAVRAMGVPMLQALHNALTQGGDSWRRYFPRG